MSTESSNADAFQGNDDTASNNVNAFPITIISSTPPVPAVVVRSLGDLNGGGYTFTDTAAVALSSYAYNSGTDTHTFNVNTIGVANETYSLVSGANFTSPKWLAPLTYSDGTPVLAGDAFSYTVTVDNVSVGATRQFLVATAIVQNNSTVIGNMRPSGVYCLTTTTGTTAIGGVADNLGAAASIANMTRGSGTAVFGGGTQMHKAGVAMVAVSAVGGSVNGRQDGNVWSIATTSQLSLAVMISTNGTVTTTGGAFSMRIKYNVTKLS